MISMSRSSLLKSHQNCRYPNFPFSEHFSSMLAKTFTFDLGKSSWENTWGRFHRDISWIHLGKFCFIKPSVARKPGKTWKINLAKSHQFSSLASYLWLSQCYNQSTRLKHNDSPRFLPTGSSLLLLFEYDIEYSSTNLSHFDTWF